MIRAALACILRLYPKPWRDRFGAEFAELLAEENLRPSVLFDIAWSAIIERAINPSGLGEIAMEAYPRSVLTLVRKPSGYLPIAMSLCAIALTLSVVVVSGAVRDPDEGTAAHLFQLLIAAQLPILGFFAAKWIARDRTAALSVIGIQMIAIGLALIPIWMFGL